MADIYFLEIVDTQANLDGSALKDGQIGLASDTWSMVASIGGDKYRYRPTEKNGVALAITFGAVSCSSMTTSGVLTGNSLSVTNGATIGASSSVTGTLTATGLVSTTGTVTTDFRTNLLQAYSGGVVTVGSDITLGTGVDLTMSVTGTILTDTIDDVSGGGITCLSDLMVDTIAPTSGLDPVTIKTNDLRVEGTGFPELTVYASSTNDPVIRLTNSIATANEGWSMRLDYSASALLDWRYGSTSVMDLSTGGDLDLLTGDYYHSGVQGFTGTGAYTNFTISGGIITGAS